MAARIMATRTVEKHLENQESTMLRPELEFTGPMANLDTAASEQRVERKRGFCSRVADMLWRMTCGLSFSSFFIPVGPAFRRSNALSVREKVQLEADLMGLYHI